MYIYILYIYIYDTFFINVITRNWLPFLFTTLYILYKNSFFYPVHSKVYIGYKYRFFSLFNALHLM